MIYYNLTQMWANLYIYMLKNICNSKGIDIFRVLDWYDRYPRFEILFEIRFLNDSKNDFISITHITKRTRYCKIINIYQLWCWNKK